jgi:hypothetical protein
MWPRYHFGEAEWVGPRKYWCKFLRNSLIRYLWRQIQSAGEKGRSHGHVVSVCEVWSTSGAIDSSTGWPPASFALEVWRSCCVPNNAPKAKTQRNTWVFLLRPWIRWHVNRSVLVDNVWPKIIHERALGGSKLKECGPFLHLNNIHPHLCNDELKEIGIRRRPHPRTVLIWLRTTSGYCVILSNISTDGHSALPRHCKPTCAMNLISIEVGTFLRVLTESKQRLRECVKSKRNCL